MIIKIVFSIFIMPIAAIALLLSIIFFFPILIIILECAVSLSLNPIISFSAEVREIMTWGKFATIYTIALISTIGALRV